MKTFVWEGFPVLEFGSGEPIALLPGLMDAWQNPVQASSLLSRQFASLGAKYTVFWIGRRRPATGGSTRDLALETLPLIQHLGIRKIAGISMGGLLAQFLAIQMGSNLSHLVLATCGARQSVSGRQRIQIWLDLAEKGDWKSLQEDSLDLIYQNKSGTSGFNKSGLVVQKPESASDFRSWAKACLNHSALSELEAIRASTKIVLAEGDLLFTPDCAEDFRSIAGVKIDLLPEAGHGMVGPLKAHFIQTVLEHLAT